jgi:hypothetical protein
LSTSSYFCRFRPPGLAKIALLALLQLFATRAGAEESPGTTTPSGTAPTAQPPAAPEPDSTSPVVVGAQYTYVLQHQSALRSPYAGPLSLKSSGDTQSTNTLGLYTGWAPVYWGQLYFDVEKFMGAGVSGATGLGGLTNGNAIPAGYGVFKQFYIARLYARFMLPLGTQVNEVDRAQDQIGGTEPATRLELKVGHLAAPDDFDQNRYANSPRTQFLNWSLMNDTAWDYAADTRGYTDGIMLGYISPAWSLKYGVYRMPLIANGEPLEASLLRANGQNLQFSYTGLPTGTAFRLLAYLNSGAMGNYAEALALANATHATPRIAATAAPGRQKHGFELDAEQPLADDGATGMFLRWGWNNGRDESFAFTEVDEVLSTGVQLSGAQWHQPDGQLGFGVANEELSAAHRAYLAAGGCGFELCDGALNYAHEQILEAYYRLERIWPEDPGPVRWQIGPDYQYIRNPGFNRDRGPVSFWAIRLHVEY